MAKSSKFDFDISAKNDKKRRSKGRRGMSGAFETSSRGCDAPGCENAGQYRAPRSPDNLEDFYWFCLDHVREFNQRWNFFENYSEAELAAQVEADRVWGRETKPLNGKGELPGGVNSEGKAWARFGVDDPAEVLGANATMNHGKARSGATRRLPPTERKALSILDCADTMTKTEIRKQYKAMVKDLHPDMNGGSRADEDRLREVVWAWDQIKISRSFRE